MLSVEFKYNFSAFFDLLLAKEVVYNHNCSFNY